MHYPSESSQQSCEISTIIFPILQKQETGKEETDIRSVYLLLFWRRQEDKMGGKKGKGAG